MPRTRAERRAKERQVKRRVLAQLERLSVQFYGRAQGQPQRRIGRYASTHGRPCSCVVCKRGPRVDRSPIILDTDFYDPEELEAQRLQELEDAAWDDWCEQELGWEDQEDQFVGYSWEEYRADVEYFQYDY